MDNATNVNIHDNTVYNIVSPVDVNDGITTGGNSENITIANNDVHASSLKRGIVTNAGMIGPTTITGNTVTGATLFGILLRSPYPQTVTGNTVIDCAIGIQINSTITTSPEIRGNNIYGNTNFGLFNDSTLTVDAQNNWWGSAAGPNTPGADSVGGIAPVNDTPWLVAPVGTAIVTTGPIANPVLGSTGRRQTTQVLIMLENIETSEETVQIVGYYLTNSQTTYVLALLAVSPSETPNSVHSATYYADFDAFEYQFVPSSANVLISVWGLAADGSLVSAHRLVNAELTQSV